MNKHLHSFFLSFAILFSVSIQAQDTILEELFDDSTLGQFTAVSQLGDGEMWEARDFNERFFAQMNGFNDGIQDNIDWLISPALDMDAYTGEVLIFENASSFDGPDLELLYSTDYDGSGDPTTATWIDLSSSVTWSPGNYEYVASGDIDLSAVEGTAYIAFKYTSNGAVQGKLFQIDDILISGTDVSSVETVEITSFISQPIVSNDYLNFNVLQDVQNVTVSVSSMNGSATRINNRSVTGNVSLSLATLPRGVYVMIVQAKGKIGTYKFIK
jgi:hypothetical protein